MSLLKIDRRNCLRVTVNVPIRARLVNSILPDRYAELMNISESGAYLATWHRYREGDKLDLWTDLATRDWSQSVEWRCVGHVVRVQALDVRAHTLGVAVQFEPAPSKRDAVPGYPASCVA